MGVTQVSWLLFVALLLLNRSMGIVDTRDRPSKREPDYGDSSWPLYAMYTNISQEDDNNLAERCQRDTDGTMVFVSARVELLGLRIPTGQFRRVYLLPPSAHCLQSQSKTSSQIHKIPLRSTLRTYTSFSAIRTHLKCPFYPLWPHRPRSLRLDMLSG